VRSPYFFRYELSFRNVQGADLNFKSFTSLCGRKFQSSHFSYNCQIYSSMKKNFETRFFVFLSFFYVFIPHNQQFQYFFVFFNGFHIKARIFFSNFNSLEFKFSPLWIKSKVEPKNTYKSADDSQCAKVSGRTMNYWSAKHFQEKQNWLSSNDLISSAPNFHYGA
jgi:hypothetical protein